MKIMMSSLSYTIFFTYSNISEIIGVLRYVDAKAKRASCFLKGFDISLQKKSQCIVKQT